MADPARFLVGRQGDSDRVAVQGFDQAKKTGRWIAERDRTATAELVNTETGERWLSRRRGNMIGFGKV